MFGWGTTLTNDLGIKPNNFVMKATLADGVPTVKLSDAEGKYTGPPEKIALYKEKVASAIAQTAVKEMVLV
jgi:nicotinate phosphoribosyltransferase